MDASDNSWQSIILANRTLKIELNWGVKSYVGSGLSITRRLSEFVTSRSPSRSTSTYVLYKYVCMYVRSMCGCMYEQEGSVDACGCSKLGDLVCGFEIRML